MIKDFLEYIWNIIKSRFFIMILIFAILFSCIVVRVFNLQIVNHDMYKENYVQRNEKELTIKSTRGLIYDCNGNLLAYNELTYSVQITDTLESSNMKNDQMNEILNKTIIIIEKYGDSVIDDFPLTYDSSGIIRYRDDLSENSRLRFLKNIYGTETLDTEEERKSDTTAAQAFEYLKEKYNLKDSTNTKENVRKIIMLRYNLSMNTYQKYIATTVAQNISEKTMAAIYEHEAEIPGVVVSEDTIRRYNDPIYFAHIIGYTGRITEDELITLNSDTVKYDRNDIVGKNGIEASFEDVLSGTKGSQKVLVDSLGRVLSVIKSTDSIAGNNVYITIDSDLQKAAYHQLEQKLAGVLVARIVNGKMTEEQEEDYYIPIKDVYYQILNNNIVSIDNFSAQSATENEKNIYKKFKSRYDNIIDRIKQDLYDDKAKGLASLGDEWNEYYTYIYRKLALSSYGLEVIKRDIIDTSDEVYVDWIADKISLRTFLKHCISMNWIDLTKLDIDTTYLDGDQIYDGLVNYILNTLMGDNTFDKIIYKYLVNNGTLKGGEICKTLFDQKIIPYDENAYNQLGKSSAYAYTFIIEKLTDLSITPAQLALNPCSGSVVITDPYTGDIKALVSYPSYDNNLFSGTIDTAEWNRLRNDQSNPLFNRATKTRTAPGSTFKMVSSIAALEEGIITSNTKINTHGIYINENLTNTPKCWYYPKSHGPINVITAIEKSCNYFFYEVGFRLGSRSGSFSHDAGLAILKKYATMFGFTEKSGIELDEYVPLFSTKDVVMSSIGQGSHSYTPVQLARYVSTIANDGYNYELTLLERVTDSNENVILEKVQDSVEKADISNKSLDTAKKGMHEMATNHRVFRNLEFSIAGKTGTAQENLNNPPHALFVGFAPYEKPEIAISVVIPCGYTSSYASETARNILRYYFGYITMEQIMNGKAELPNTAIVSGD